MIEECEAICHELGSHPFQTSGILLHTLIIWLLFYDMVLYILAFHIMVKEIKTCLRRELFFTRDPGPTYEFNAHL